MRFKKTGVYEIDKNGCRLYSEDAYDIWEVFPKGYENPEWYEDDEEDEFDILAKIKDVYNHNKNSGEWDDETDDDNLYTITDDAVIYLSTDFYIKKIDRKTHKCLYKIKLKKNIVDMNYIYQYDLFEDGDKLFLIDQKNCDHVTIYNVTDDYKMLFSKLDKSYIGDSYDFNYYKNKLFIGSSSDGIYVVDTDTGKQKHITNTETTEMHIFGDKWVYFIATNRNLYRVTQDGKTVEMLLGTIF